MVYHIPYAQDSSEGYVTHSSKKIPVRYIRGSQQPEDEEDRFIPTEMVVPETRAAKIDILKQCARYDRTKSETPYTTEYRIG